MTPQIALMIASMIFVPAQAQEEAPAKEKKICRRIVATGTIMPKRFCLTKSDWSEFNKRNRDDAEGAMSRRGGGMCSGDGVNCPR